MKAKLLSCLLLSLIAALQITSAALPAANVEPKAAAGFDVDRAISLTDKMHQGVKTGRKKAANLTSEIISFAPAAKVEFGDDIDEDGTCKAEIEQYCGDVEEEGEGKLADCISDVVAQSEDIEGMNGDLPDVSDECRDELFAFKISRNSNINRNIPLAKACKADADKFCNVTWFFGYKVGQVISCLRDVKAKVQKPCQKQLFKVQMDAAADIRADPILWEACKDDSETLCKDVKKGGGRVQGCLRDSRIKLSWACEEQLYRQEMENADDIRLSVRLFDRCLPDKRKFCKNVQPGNARAKECLEENRDDLTPSCRAEIDEMIERRVRDFRLDSKLRDACADVIFNMCAYFGDLDDIDVYDSDVINCLQDYKKEITNKKCVKEVQKYSKLASQDIRFDVPLAEACFDDRQKYCGKVPPGSARVIRCLSNNRLKLSQVCKATLFDEEIRFSENIDFQFPVKAACKKEIEKYCKDIPHGDARVLRCLSEKKDDKDFGKGCQKEVRSLENQQATDYRLNYRLSHACKKTVDLLCSHVCVSTGTAGTPDQICGGKVLRCLTDKVDSIVDPMCKKEVLYFEKMEVTDFHNDIILAEACRTDVDKWCLNVPSGEGRIHKCLRDKRKELSEACRKEELALEEMESDTIELNVNLLKSCKVERALYCKSVQPGSARVFRCLAENMNDADFGNTCKFQIVYKLQRRQSNWKLDPPLRKACREDVQNVCSQDDSKNSEEGLVYKCMVKKYDELSSGCQKELGRALHMAFFVWQEGSLLTSECDKDIKQYCLAVSPNMEARPGAVGTCLGNILDRQDARRKRMGQPVEEERRQLAGVGKGADADEDEEEREKKPISHLKKAVLSDACYVLSDIAEPPDMKREFDSSLSFALLSNMGRVSATTGIPLVVRDRSGKPQQISLTGWMATLGLAAMVMVVAVGTFTLYKRLRGVGDDSKFSVVMKQQPK